MRTGDNDAAIAGVIVRGSGASAEIGNISTRGYVDLGDKVMIGGFIVSGQNGVAKVVVRALGPSLTAAGVQSALPDPTLSLRDVNGTQIAFNDDWMDDLPADIEATGLAPSSTRESAIVRTLPSGNYTAVVSGYNGAIGVGLVEVYNLQ